MTPGLPPLNLSMNTASRSGDINAPNTVNFGGFGSGSGGNGGIGGSQLLPLAAVAVGVFLVMRRR